MWSKNSTDRKGEQKTIQHVRSVRPLPPPALGQQQSGSSRVMSCLAHCSKIESCSATWSMASSQWSSSCGNTRRSWARSELRTWEHGRENTPDPIYFLKYLTPKSNIKNGWNWQMHKRKHKKSTEIFPDVYLAVFRGLRSDLPISPASLAVGKAWMARGSPDIGTKECCHWLICFRCLTYPYRLRMVSAGSAPVGLALQKLSTWPADAHMAHELQLGVPTIPRLL